MGASVAELLTTVGEFLEAETSFFVKNPFDNMGDTKPGSCAEFTSSASHEAASSAVNHVSAERKLSLRFVKCFYCQYKPLQQKVFSTGSKPDLLKEKPQNCTAEITRPEEVCVVLHSSLK